MKKTRPTSHSSNDKHDASVSYTKGYQVERRASLGESTQQRIPGATEQRLDGGTHLQRSSSQDNKDPIGPRHSSGKTFQDQTNKNVQQPSFERNVSPGNSGRLSNGLQERKSLNESTVIPTGHTHNREHQMTGQMTNPETEVQFNTGGH